ncbi:MAG: hypothetical protein ACERKX_13190 [Anaerolineales bacterium]
MCFSQYTQYARRPVYEYEPPVRPENAPPTKADLDDNLYGPKPLPSEWQQAVEPSNGHSHEVTAHGAPAVAVQAVASTGNSIASVSTQTLEAVVVELADGTKLLICPL